MSKQKPMVVLGRLGAPYGVRGWIHVQSYTDPISNLLGYETWYLQHQGRCIKRLRCIEGRVHGVGCVVSLEGYTCPEDVRELTHYEVAVPREALPTLPAGAYYWTDLVGLQVINESRDIDHGAISGRVTEIFRTPADELLVIMSEGERESGRSDPILIPFRMDQFVKTVDLEKRSMRVDWPEWFE